MEKELTKLYIQKNIFLNNSDNYLLKLNRDLNQLEVYQKVSNRKIYDYYSIRKDFDLSTIQCMN